jgi:tripartite ATP-independent transporter DctM subunit
MGIELLTVLLFLAVLTAFAAGIPVGFALGGVAMLFGWLTWGPQAFNIIPRTAHSAVSDFLLLAVPLFIFMGQVLMHSGIGERMFHAAHVLAGRIRGGLAVGVIIVCSLIGAMVGIIGAGIMTVGSVALGPMLERGYDRRLALGAVMSGGGLGILIPPSIPMILFSSATNTSIGRMFAGALIPAAIMVALFVLYILVRCYLKPEDGPPIRDADTVGLPAKLVAVREGAVAFALIMTVLGTILFGVATPTEAAALGAVGALLVAAAYRRLNLTAFWEASFGSMQLAGMFVWILIGALVFTNFHLLMGAEGLLRDVARQAASLSPWTVIIFMQVSMLLLGFIMDEWIIILLCAPLYTPIAVDLGFDPIWFGILMILNMEIAIQTPPYGFALFYLRGVAPEGVSMLDIYRSVAPFLLIKVTVLALCMAFPSTIVWLPNLIFQ